MTYRLEDDLDRPGKTIKKPTDWRTGYVCDSQNPDNHCSYAEAVATGRPVGFVFMADDPYWFLDIDSCTVATPPTAANPSGLDWSQTAKDLMARFPGAGGEISQSGKGLHIIGRGIPPAHSCKNVVLGLELYHEKRFIALTGNGAWGNVDTDHTGALAQLVADFFPPNAFSEVQGWTDQPVPEWEGPTDDAELIKAANAGARKSAGSAFGDGVNFTDLWTGNEEKLAAKWPSDKGGYDASHADQALATHLAYWTGKNPERIRDLMYQSALARQKWDDRPDWLETSILKACGVVSGVAKGRPPILPPGMTEAPAEQASPPVVGTPSPGDAIAAGLGLGPVTTSTITLREGGRVYLTAVDQMSFFNGCVYVTDLNRVWIPSSGALLDKARFDVVYGGHIFPIDDEGKITDSPWDAMTRSRIYTMPRADRACFRPELPAGQIILENGFARVNTYIPAPTVRTPGDATPFLNHIAKLLPVEGDRKILLSYMASLVRNPGVKFQWWPVIQGAEGNGKTLIDRVLSFCVGERYSHLVNPEAMAKTGNQFNKWVSGHLYVGIEEIYVPHRRDFLESFKATVTNERTPLEGKGADQTTGDNRVNGAMFTNHHDAVPVTTDTRRYCIFFTAQQSLADIIRDGMGGSYFPDLYDWFNGRRAFEHLGPNYGLRVVNDFLMTMEIEAELDPAHLCIRAPETSSTSAALKHSLGRAEQEIMEAVAQGTPGFCGRWISSIALDDLLHRLKIPVQRNKRRAMLESIGYYPHPKLPDGRMTRPVAPDNGKPTLYVALGHASVELDDIGAIGDAYTAAQRGASSVTASEVARLR